VIGGQPRCHPHRIRRAQAVHPICDLQIEYSLISRRPESTICPLLAKIGIGVTAYGVLSRGLLSGSKPTAQGDFRAYLPRFTGDNRERNQRVIDVAAAGRRTKASPPRSWRLRGSSRRVPRSCP
jgi:aryl-alcohol dehydrogenase-like predicted oxidoreductase